MKRISEVTRITGVTRRSLQEYDKIGLLHPTAKTEGGYWLYDDKAINALMGIQVFVEVGYKRKEIKEILYLKPQELKDEIDKAILKLEAKKERLEGMIRFMQYSKQTMDLPEELLRNMSTGNPEKWLEDQSSAEALDKLITGMAKDKGDRQEIYDASSATMMQLMVLGGLKDMPYDSEEVKTCVEIITDQMGKVRSFIRIALDQQLNDEIESDEYEEGELEALLAEYETDVEEYLADINIVSFAKEMLEDPEDQTVRKIIEASSGEGSIEFILGCLEYYQDFGERSEGDE